MNPARVHCRRSPRHHVSLWRPGPPSKRLTPPGARAGSSKDCRRDQSSVWHEACSVPCLRLMVMTLSPHNYQRSGTAGQNTSTEVATIVQMLFTCWPNWLIAPRTVSAMTASRTAYSVAVGPSSDRDNSSSLCSQPLTTVPPSASESETARPARTGARRTANTHTQRRI